MNFNLIFLFIFSFALQLTPLTAQPLDFQRNRNTTVQIQNRVLQYPWAGGLNTPQFSAIDFNGDGIEDLFVFDKSTNKVLTFINKGTPNQQNYIYTPEYAFQFPPLQDWVLLRDYNADGITDIFTYSIEGAGVSVYRAKRPSFNSLSFELVSNRLLYQGLNGPSNVLVTRIDIPAIADITGDGDLDILSFDAFGNYVEHYENQSQELTGTAGDTLWFERVDRCWGKFAENSSTNSVVLNSENCGGKSASKVHTGSTLLAFDLEGDNDQDLLMGDLSFNNLVLLTNGGTPQNALMTQQDTLFPSNDQSVNISIFPAAYALDINNDGLQDLLTAPNDVESQSTHQIWSYFNTGTAQNPHFERQTEDFLTEDMIDVGEGAYPAFIDFNADGLMDFVVGNKGKYDTENQFYKDAHLTLFQNIGTLEIPTFQLVDEDYFNMSELHLLGCYPTFGDVDSDGDKDLVVGDESGRLHYFENTAALGEALQLELHTFELLTLVPNDYSAVPFLVDIDGDEKVDLVVGTAKGRIFHFRNFTPFGSETPIFSIESEKWGNVSVREPKFSRGSAAPIVTTLDDTEKLYLIVQSEGGNLSLFTDLEKDTFTLVTKNYSFINEGGRGGLTIADLNGGGDKDLLVGNRRGGVALYSQSLVWDAIEGKEKENEVRIFPNPCTAMCEIRLEGFLDFTSTETPIFTLYNIEGKRIILQPNFSASHNLLTIDVEDLPQGMYFFEVMTKNRRKVGKLLVN
ncbi:MAG: FG-GAP-like repeat-containing protein [Chitinophagales bacterium]